MVGSFGVDDDAAGPAAPAAADLLDIRSDPHPGQTLSSVSAWLSTHNSRRATCSGFSIS